MENGPAGVKTGKAQHEQMSSGLPAKADTSLSWVNWFEGPSASVDKALGIGTGRV
jgi:hypothetical protein